MRLVLWLLGSLFRKIAEQIAENREISEHPEQNRRKDHLNWNFVLSSKITLVFRSIGSFWRKQPKLTEKRKTYFPLTVSESTSTVGLPSFLYLSVPFTRTYTPGPHTHVSYSSYKIPESNPEPQVQFWNRHDFGIDIASFSSFWNSRDQKEK